VPSGRVARYLAFRTWLSPGDRMLMSPLNDDVVFFTALAAGLRSVMAPVSLATEVESRPIGSFGDAAAFSMSKHVAGAGGHPGLRRTDPPAAA
jgi:hypothetical protein